MVQEPDRSAPDRAGSKPDAEQASGLQADRPRADLGAWPGSVPGADLGPGISLVPLMLAFILIPRLVLWFAADPFPWSDSRLYRETAEMVRRLDFTDYNGMRTPGYPAFLALIGGSDRAVWLVQAVIGMAGAVLVFALVQRLTRRPRWALAAALAHGLALNQIAFEATILAETISTTALIGALYLWVRWMEGMAGAVSDPPGRHPPVVSPPGDARFLMMAGLVLGAAAFCRPILALCALPLALVPILGPRPSLRNPLRGSVKARPAGALLVLIPVLAPLLAWSAVNYKVTGYFGPTNLLGLNLTQHTGPLMEEAPPGFEPLPEIYLKYRAARAAQTGRHTMTIWYAYPEMMERTGLSLGEISRSLTRLSLELIRRHPLEYLRSAGRAWLGFWKAPNYWKPEMIKPPMVRAALYRMWQVERILQVAVFAAFLGISALVCLWTLRAPPGDRRRATGGPMAGAASPPAAAPTAGKIPSAATTLFILVCAGIVLPVSVVQALLEYGENARYGVPFQPLALMAVAVFLAGRSVSRPASPPRPR